MRASTQKHRAVDDAQRLADTVARVGAVGQLRNGEPDSGPLSPQRISELDTWSRTSGLLRGKLYDHIGVESEDVLEVLVALDCDVAQGFLLSRPLPADQLDGWLATRA